MPLTDFTIIRRSMQARKLSTGVTIASVAVSVALMLVLLSMRHAGEQAFSRGSGNAHLVVSRDSSPLMGVLNQLFYKELPPRAIEWREYQALASSAPFDWAIPTQMGDSFAGQPVMATLPEFFERFEPAPKQAWQLRPRRSADKAEPRWLKETFDVLVGAQAARATGLRVGDKIHLTHGSPKSRGSGGKPGGPAPHVHDEFTFTVVGLLEETGSAHDRALFVHLDAAWLMHALDRREAEERASGGGSGSDAHDHGDDHDHDHADGHEHAHDHACDGDHSHDHPPLTVADLTDADRQITGVLLRVATRAGSENSAAIQSVFDRLRRDPTITVAQPVQQINFLFRIVSSVDRLLLAMALVVLVSSGASILLALYNSMEQRQRQIAVLRVLGASGSRVMGLVLTESALIGAIGAVLGGVLSLAFGWLVAGAVQQSLGLYIRPVYGLDWTLAVMVGAVLVAAAAGVAPALRAYRTSVGEHLRPAA